jgi:hypothetical protein
LRYSFHQSYKAQHDILERSLKASVKSLNEEVIKLQKDNKNGKEVDLGPWV